MRWTKEEDSILKQYYGKIKIGEIPISRSKKAIICRASQKKLKGNMSLSKKTYEFNEDFFSIINNSSSYLAGLLAADGCIYNNQVMLEVIDKELIEYLTISLNYNGKIGSRSRENRKTSYYINITSKKMVEDLNNIWSITSKKSLTLQPPNISNIENILSFIIGYIDGDGHSYINKYNKLVFGCAGNKDIINWISQYLNLNVRQSSHPQIYILQTTGKYAIALGQKLLSIETPYRLSRKWNHIRNLINAY